jgi:hypothetical protein
LTYNVLMKHVKLILTILVCAYFWYCAKNYSQWHILDNVNLIFHEAGHTIFFFLGEFIKVAAGSIFQVLVPFLIALHFLFSGQRVSSGIASMWAGQSLLNVSVYARDAEAMILPLLGGDSVGHDWQYLLGRLGMLDQTQAVANWILVAGFTLIVMGTVASLYFSKANEEIPGRDFNF